MFFSENNISQTDIYNCEKNNLNSMLLLPLYCSDLDLIHEMIHAVMSSPLLVMPEKHIYIKKSGLSCSVHEGEDLLEESITQLEANHIYYEMKNKGIEPFIREHSPNVHENKVCYYDYFIPLIEKFYKTFWDDITYSRITINKNFLIEKVGKENYKQLINTIKDYKLALKYGIGNNFLAIINHSVIPKMNENCKTKKLV